MWAVRLQTGACCWCHLLITNMYEQRERSSLQPGLVLGSALGRSEAKMFSITLHLTFTGREPQRGFDESQPLETFLTNRFSALARTFTKPIHFHLMPRQRATISLFLARRVSLLPPLSCLLTKPVDCSVPTPASGPIRDMLWYIWWYTFCYNGCLRDRLDQSLWLWGTWAGNAEGKTHKSHSRPRDESV